MDQEAPGSNLGRLKRLSNRLVLARDIWSNHPWIDWAFVVVVVAAHLILLKTGRWDFTVGAMNETDRFRAVVTAGSVSAFLFGFATASIAFFYGSAKGHRNDLLRKVMGAELVSTFNAAISAPLLVVFTVGIALFFDTGKDGHGWIGWLLEVSILLLVARCVRLRWLFVRTLALEAQDAQTPATDTAPAAPSTAHDRPRTRQPTGR